MPLDTQMLDHIIVPDAAGHHRIKPVGLLYVPLGKEDGQVISAIKSVYAIQLACFEIVAHLSHSLV